MPNITGSQVAEFFEKGRSGKHPVGVRTSADSICGAADNGCGGFLMASSFSGLDAADCRLSEATRLIQAEARTGSTFGFFLPPPPT
jgi:hypothetical protein